MTEADQRLPRDGGRKKGCRGGITKGHKETWDDRDVRNFDCGDDFMIYTHQNLLNCIP